MSDFGSFKIDCFSLVKGPGANKNSDLPIVNLANNQPYIIRASLGDPMWRHAWSAFLLEFREHLKEKGWFELAYIAFALSVTKLAWSRLYMAVPKRYTANPSTNH